MPFNKGYAVMSYFITFFLGLQLSNDAGFCCKSLPSGLVQKRREQGVTRKRDP